MASSYASLSHQLGTLDNHKHDKQQHCRDDVIDIDMTTLRIIQPDFMAQIMDVPETTVYYSPSHIQTLATTMMVATTTTKDSTTTIPTTMIERSIIMNNNNDITLGYAIYLDNGTGWMHQPKI
jgi:hypothetical protein